MPPRRVSQGRCACSPSYTRPDGKTQILNPRARAGEDNAAGPENSAALRPDALRRALASPGGTSAALHQEFQNGVKVTSLSPFFLVGAIESPRQKQPHRLFFRVDRQAAREAPPRGIPA